MDFVLGVIEEVSAFVPTLLAGAVVAVVLYAAHRLLESEKRFAEGHRFRNQLIMLGLTFVGGLTVVLVLPISETLRGQLLSLIGILLSAAIALSSTTMLGNALAGVMLRVVRGFRMGDFVRVGEHFGRVSERGLFHTEIQTEERELTTLPNLYLVTHPVTTTRSSGTIVSATVSLGYDVSRGRVEKLLLDAAEECELEEPYTQIVELRDFSVTYRIAGLLKDVKQIISTRSRLRACMLDALHRGDIEIVSPTFMNTRALDEDARFIPHISEGTAETPRRTPEQLVFDKAEEAESLETLEVRHDELVEEIDAIERRLKEAEDEAESARLKRTLQRLTSRRDRLARVLESAKQGAAHGSEDAAADAARQQ